MADTEAVAQAWLVDWLGKGDGRDNIHPFVVHDSDLH